MVSAPCRDALCSVQRWSPLRADLASPTTIQIKWIVDSILEIPEFSRMTTTTFPLSSKQNDSFFQIFALGDALFQNNSWIIENRIFRKVVEFDHFRMQAGLPSFVMSVSEWIEKTNAIGIIVKKGRYGGTYAFKDIAFEFGTAISVTFKLYLIDEFQRLKEEEQKQIGWTAKRELSKINYRIHTDAIKSHLIPEEVTPAQANIIYAEEADVLNVAMFGMTAKQWREANPDLKGNIRDYATINELICLSNMENINAVLINDGMPQGERLIRLNQIAIQQMQVLEGNDNRNLLR